jgi:hypothetical protein
MLASMIFRKEPFFHGHDNYDQVIHVVPIKELIYVIARPTHSLKCRCLSRACPEAGGIVISSQRRLHSETLF